MRTNAWESTMIRKYECPHYDAGFSRGFAWGLSCTTLLWVIVVVVAKLAGAV